MNFNLALRDEILENYAACLKFSLGSEYSNKSKLVSFSLFETDQIIEILFKPHVTSVARFF